MKHIMIAALLACGATAALGQKTTGHWDFDGGNLNATVGQNGQYYLVPPAPSGNTQSKTSFGTTAAFGIGNIGGVVANVMRVQDLGSNEGYGLFPVSGPNGGGAFLNQYTLIYDVYYPATSTNTFISFGNTNECNTNDQDFAGRRDFADGWGVGISGIYEGKITVDTWHRVGFAVDLANGAGPTMRKYIDGVLVGTQILSAGVDGRWALYSSLDSLPTLLLADNDGDVDEHYVNAIQFHAVALDDSTMAALGGASASNIPVSATVDGNWTFDGGNLNATVGNNLTYFNGCGADPDPCSQDLAAETQFGSASSFGIANLPDGSNPSVMRWAATIPCTGYNLPHGAKANGGGQRVNQYTILMDVYVASSDFFLGPWVALYQTNPFNSEDAMLWIRTSDGNLGDDGEYPIELEFACLPDTWLRIVAVVDTSTDTLTKYVLRDLGSGVEMLMGSQSAGGLDSKRTLVPATLFGQDIFLPFTDEDQETLPGYVNCIQIRDYAMTPAEVAALGAPGAGCIPIVAGTCPGDANGDGKVDQLDLNLLLATFNLMLGDAGYNGDADFSGDGKVDQLDLNLLLAVFQTNC